ncbi:MAG: hypothetical protein ACKOTA_01205 [Solirubrobacterales bacterium]
MAAWEDERLPGDVDLLRDPFPGAELAWAVRESAKPGREPGERWTLQAGPRWSEEHLEDEPIEVERHLLGALGVALQAGGALPPPDFLAAHRWRYSQVTEALDEPFLLDELAGIGASGDWRGPVGQCGRHVGEQVGRLRGRRGDRHPLEDPRALPAREQLQAARRPGHALYLYLAANLDPLGERLRPGVHRR